MDYKNEQQLVTRFRELFAASEGVVSTWGGEDAALIRPVPGETVACLDSLVEDVHFRLEWYTAFDLGYKSVAVNYSDLASCGASPLYIMIGLSAPAVFLNTHLEGFYSGLRGALHKWGGAFAGGDYTRSERVVVTVSAVGVLPEGGRFWSRGGCVPGEMLYLTGIPGSADSDLKRLEQGLPAAGTTLLRPEPALDAAGWLRRNDIAVGGCCDTSDSLSASLHLLGGMSGVRVVVDTDCLYSIRGAGQPQGVLHGGEDFELLFSGPETIDGGAFYEETGRVLTPIGCIESGSGIVDSAGRSLDNRGYDHLKRKIAPEG